MALCTAVFRPGPVFSSVADDLAHPTAAQKRTPTPSDASRPTSWMSACTHVITAETHWTTHADGHRELFRQQGRAPFRSTRFLSESAARTSFPVRLCGCEHPSVNTTAAQRGGYGRVCNNCRLCTSTHAARRARAWKAWSGGSSPHVDAGREPLQCWDRELHGAAPGAVAVFPCGVASCAPMFQSLTASQSVCATPSNALLMKTHAGPHMGLMVDHGG